MKILINAFLYALLYNKGLLKKNFKHCENDIKKAIIHYNLKF